MVEIRHGDALSVLRTLESESVSCVVTSPPYWQLRAYGTEPVVWDDGWRGELGQEPTVQLYLAHLLQIFAEVKRIMRKDATLFLNIGDTRSAQGGDHSKHNRNQPNVGAARCHANGSGDVGTRAPQLGFQAKTLYLIPERFLIGLQDLGFVVRSKIVWQKPSAMPESATDRPTESWEPIYFLTKSPKYWSDFAAVREPCSEKSQERMRAGYLGNDPVRDSQNRYGAHFQRGPGYECPDRNIRNVWTFSNPGTKFSHYAAFPEELPKRCILAGCQPGGTVLDPFAGTGTTLAVAVSLGRKAIGIEAKPEYVEMAKERMAGVTPGLFAEAP